ncbi:MAG: hypothetical protein R3Y24_17430, partial [Eubacteriales bacterium]
KQEELVHIQKICKKIKEESISYHDLDAQKYLEEIDAQGKIGNQFFKILEDFKEKVVHYLPSKPSFIIEPHEPIMNKKDFTLELLRYCEQKKKKLYIIKEGMMPTVEIEGIRYICQLELPRYINLPFPLSGFFYITKTYGYRFINVYRYEETIYE